VVGRRRSRSSEGRGERQPRCSKLRGRPRRGANYQVSGRSESRIAPHFAPQIQLAAAVPPSRSAALRWHDTDKLRERNCSPPANDVAPPSRIIRRPQNGPMPTKPFAPLSIAGKESSHLPEVLDQIGRDTSQPRGRSGRNPFTRALSQKSASWPTSMPGKNDHDRNANPLLIAGRTHAQNGALSVQLHEGTPPLTGWSRTGARHHPHLRRHHLHVANYRINIIDTDPPPNYPVALGFHHTAEVISRCACSMARSSCRDGGRHGVQRPQIAKVFVSGAMWSR